MTMRAVAARLDVTPMSLYHPVGDRAELPRALSDRVYAEALKGASELAVRGQRGYSYTHYMS